MNKLIVVQSNDLVEAAYSLSLDEIRVICLASAKVDSRQKNIGEIKITVAEFIEAYDLNEDRHIFEKMCNAVRSLMRKPIKLDIGDDEIRELAWLDGCVYKKSDEESYVLLQFSRNVEPYLFELKERFTVVNFEYAARLNTPFSFRLYQWLYNAKDLNKHEEGEDITLELDIDWMKSQSGLNGLYDRWDHFNDKVLNPAVEKINSSSDISIVDLIPIKTGKKITAVQFNYEVEQAPQTKPLRPRLHRKPKATSDSHTENEYLRKNEALLVNYEKELKQYDPKLKLDIADLRRLIEIYKALGECSEIHKHYHARVKELQERTEKKIA